MHRYAKILTFLLAFIMLFGVVGCGNQTSQTGDASSSSLTVRSRGGQNSSSDKQTTNSSENSSVTASVSTITSTSTSKSASTSEVLKTFSVAYTETNETLTNPYRGFYYPIYIDSTETTASERWWYEDKKTYNALLHLRIDLSPFSGAANGSVDKDLTESFLSSLDKEFASLYSAGSAVIIRFAYDKNEGVADQEPAIGQILKHIEQLSPLFNKYEKMIVAIECGLIGKWGEMHTSKIVTQENINAILDAYLKYTPSTLPILVRKPSYLYKYLGYTLSTLDQFKEDPTLRIGFYNDGYLASSDDYGTYENREKETAFMAKVNKYLPYGGEVEELSGSTLNQLPNCVSEMFSLGLNHLNSVYNETPINRWKNTTYSLGDSLYSGKTDYDYIENHMGYRLVLNTLSYAISSKTVSFDFDIKNVGFGTLFKSKNAYLIFESGNTTLTYKVENMDYASLKFEVPVSELGSLTYKVYLRISDEPIDNFVPYSIALANGIYDSEKFANLLISDFKI